MACQYSIFTPQQSEANDKTQTPLVQVECHPHPFPDRDALFALACLIAIQRKYLKSRKHVFPMVHAYGFCLYLQVTIMFPKIKTGQNLLKNTIEQLEKEEGSG